MDIGRILQKQWGEIKSYFSIYTPDNLKKVLNGYKLTEILGFTGIVIIGYLLSLLLLDIGKEVIPKNLGSDFIQLPFVIAFIGILAFILLLNLLTIRKKSRWINSYIVIILLVIMFSVLGITNEPAWLKGVFIFAIVFLTFPQIYYLWKFPKWIQTIMIIIFVALILLNIGIFSVDKLYGTPSFGAAFLNNCTNTSQRLPYNITKCESVSGKVLANYNLNCIFSPPLGNISGYVEFVLKNGSTVNHTFNGNFIPTGDIERLDFNFNGVNSENETICFSTAINRDFVGEEEYKSNKEKFVTYFLGLLYISLLGIPLSVLEIKKKFMEGR